MCPRDAIAHPQLMSLDTWASVLRRLDPQEIFRVVIAGYGEATTHPRFSGFVEAMRGHPVRFDMVSNGHLLDTSKIAQLDGVIDWLIVSFSSIDPAIYRQIHVNLDQQRVMENLRSAQAMFKHTRLVTAIDAANWSVPALIFFVRKLGIRCIERKSTITQSARKFPSAYLSATSIPRRRNQLRSSSQRTSVMPGCARTISFASSCTRPSSFSTSMKAGLLWSLTLMSG